MMKEKRLTFLVIAVLGLTGLGSAEYSRTDVVAAAKSGDIHAVHKLLEIDAAAAVEATDAMGYTALHWAGIRGHWRCFSELLAAGADANAVGADGGTPLHWACHHDRADMVAQLLDRGADPAVANQWGRVPLHVAARRNCLAVAALLLEWGADADAATREGWTPLHVASMAGHEAMVALLEAHGADSARTDHEGKTAAERWRARPAALALAEERLAEYEGLFDLGGGFRIKVWQDNGVLRIREFAPDGLYPVAADEFHCVQEPWQVHFERDAAGVIDAVVVDFLRRSVRGQRTLSPRYVGSEACLGCHSGADQGHAAVKWMQSRHGHAYWRLGARWALFLAKLRPNYADLDEPIADRRCLLCHVTGSQDDDALFATAFDSSEGVGCEACHGPGSEYMEPEVMGDRAAFRKAGGRIPDADTCRSCHRRSENFDFAEWWPKIAHPRPEGS